MVPNVEKNYSIFKSVFSENFYGVIFFSFFFWGGGVVRKTMVPTVKKNYSILSTEFFFGDFYYHYFLRVPKIFQGNKKVSECMI